MSVKSCGHSAHVRGCEDCRAYSRERRARQRELNPERVREQRRRSARNHREAERERTHRWYMANRDQAIARIRQWQDENPDAVREASRLWYDRHRDELLARAKEWRDENQTRRREAAERWRKPRQQATRAAAVNAGSPWSDAELAVLLDDSMASTEIAFALGRSLASVQQKRWRLLGRRREAVAS